MPAERSVISILQLVSRSLYWWTLVKLSRCQFTLELVKFKVKVTLSQNMIFVDGVFPAAGFLDWITGIVKIYVNKYLLHCVLEPQTCSCDVFKTCRSRTL